MEDMMPVMKASAVLRLASSLQDSAPESDTTSWLLPAPAVELVMAANKCFWVKLWIYDYWLYEYEYGVEERGWKFENVWIKNVQNVDRVEKNDDEDDDDQTSW